MGCRVLIVDDMSLYRGIFRDILSSMEGVQVVGAVSSGEQALMKMETSSVDLVVLGLNLPGMDGIEVLQKIRRGWPSTQVVIVSSCGKDNISMTMRALRHGALDFIHKSDEVNAQTIITKLRTELQPLIHLVESNVSAVESVPIETQAKPSAVREPVAKPEAPRPKLPNVPHEFSVLAIGVSTGGPKALSEIIPQLPKNFPIPIVVVQHMPALFTQALADDLGRKSSITVKEASEGDPLTPGQMLVAPGGKHLVVRKAQDGFVAGITDDPPENNCKPSVDVLFISVSECFAGENVLAVVLTGMGCDGLKGVQSLKSGDCYCITQSESTCAVYEMPQAVDKAGLSDESLDLGCIAARLIALASAKACF